MEYGISLGDIPGTKYSDTTGILVLYGLYGLSTIIYFMA